jgi:hypothetical protein
MQKPRAILHNQKEAPAEMVDYLKCGKLREKETNTLFSDIRIVVRFTIRKT